MEVKSHAHLFKLLTCFSILKSDWSVTFHCNAITHTHTTKIHATCGDVEIYLRQSGSNQTKVGDHAVEVA